MTRRRFFVTLLGGFALLIFAVPALRSVVRADLPESTATQIYQPSFDEWAFVYLTASYRDCGSQTHFVSVGRESKNGRLRYQIIGRYSKTPPGQDWFERIGSKLRAGIEADCRHWTAEGFKIGLNDFDIDIAPLNDKPQ